MVLRPLGDISDYFSNVKTDGFEDEAFEKNVDLSLVKLIKNTDEINSPHEEKAGKPEDSLIDQFVVRVTSQKNGEHIRNSFKGIGIETTDMMIGRNWKVRKTPGIYELDLQFRVDQDGKVLLEAQTTKSDTDHLNGATTRIGNHQEDFEAFFWVAKEHLHIDELETNLKWIKWSDNRKMKKIFFITKEQLMYGFEMRDIEVIDIDEIIKKS